MAGALYIWIAAAFAIGCGGVMLLLIGIFWIGHWIEKRHGGATHGFLEIPEGSRSRPARSHEPPGSPESPAPPTPPPPAA